MAKPRFPSILINTLIRNGPFGSLEARLRFPAFFININFLETDHSGASAGQAVISLILVEKLGTIFSHLGTFVYLVTSFVTSWDRLRQSWHICW